jgi:hypothetical protein
MMNAGTRELKILAAAWLMSLVGCAAPEVTAPPEDEVASVVLAITNAPADAPCLRITVEGATTAVRSLPLMTNASTTFTLDGLPAGAVTFTAEAFGVACPSVTAESVATWVSDEVPAMLPPGQVTSVTLALHRPGRANVSVDFPMSCSGNSGCPAGTVCIGGMCKQDIGGSCMTDSDCAKGACSANVCKKTNGAACGASAECASGLCSGGVCTTTPPTCGGATGCPNGTICIGGLCKQDIGGSCMTDSDCAKGGCSANVCRKANGAACGASVECASGLCSGGVCTTTTPPTCGGATGCPNGTICVGGMCKQDAGGSCMTDSDCAKGACSANVCKKTNGAACGASAECASGLCSGGVCAMPLCGGPGQGCCGGNTCATGSLCNTMGVCVACGGVGQSCCGGNTCAAGGVCAGGTCTSGPSPGPALQWKLDESGGTTALDASGNGFNGTYMGVVGTPAPSMLVPAAGAAGNPFSRVFVRANQHAVRLATIPAALKPANGLTVSAWYRATSVDTSGAELVSAGDQYILRLRAGQIEFAKRITGATHVNCAAAISNHLDGAWHHLAAVTSTAGMKLYFDGVERCANTHGENLLYDRGADFWAGRHGNASTAWDFEGNLDDVRVYTRALTPLEITALAAAAQ